MLVGGAEDGAQTLDVPRVLDVDVRVAEVQFHSGAKMRVGGASRDLVDRVVLQRVDAAEPDQPIGILRDLVARPVVFFDDAGTFILRHAGVSPRTAGYACAL